MRLTQKVSRRPASWFCLLLLATATWFALPTSLRSRVEPTAYAATFTVTNTNDDGPGSLRQAIVTSNLNLGPSANVISFSIPGTGVRTINLASDLPTITAPVTIDGTTQPGFAGTPIVQLDGQAVMLGLPAGGVTAEEVRHGLDISAGNCTVRCLVLIRFGDSAIVLRTNGNNVLQGNYIGTDPTGTVIRPNSSGINVQSSNNTIGGNTVASRNVITGNPFGAIYIFGNANKVLGNFIGVDAKGTASLGHFPGIDIYGNNNTIGGNHTNDGANVISGNAFGVFIRSTGTIVQGNLIGTDAAGKKAVPNDVGIALDNRSATTTIQQNLISGNGNVGISIGNSTGNTVDNNIIGLDTDRLPLGNGGDAIFVDAGANTIYSNRIDFSGGAGVRIKSGVGNSLFNNEIARNAIGVQVDTAATGASISGNTIFSNSGLGIDLGPTGVTQNDPGDGDTGANNLQNFPVVTSAIYSTAMRNTTVNGTINSTPNTTFLIELFISEECDASGFGEGRRFVGHTGGQPSITTGSDGSASFTVVTGGPNPGEFITATATDPAHNTSEFSRCLQIASPGLLSFKSFDFAANENVGSGTITVVRTGGSMGAVTVDYATSDGTAKAGLDYTATSGTLTFADGETSRSFAVPILNDTLVEGTETFNLILSNATNGALLNYRPARAVILDDESPPPPIIFALSFGYNGFIAQSFLLNFNSEVPGQMLSSVAISGLQPFENITSIDFRPLNGRLYGIGSSNRLYTIDTGTAVATTVGTSAFNPAVSGAAAISFNPVTDRIRLTTTSGQNLQLNPDTGQVVSVDTNLVFVGAPPPNADPNPVVRGLANGNKFTGATSSTTYAINFRGDQAASTTLMTLGSEGGSPQSPSTGQLFTVKQLTTAIYAFHGFDIADNGRGFVVLQSTESGFGFLLKLFPDGGSESNLVEAAESIVDLAAVPIQRLQFSSALYSVNESAGAATITVKRNGGSSGQLSVNYASSDGTAMAGLDYTATSGTLNFADGETSKTFTIPLLDDSVIEGVESINLTLSNATSGAVAGPRSTATIAITDEATEPGITPIDNADFFVRQHYADFLSRQPDAGGLSFWTNHITQCFNDAACIHDRRIGTSAAFFIENEFQQTGFFIYRFYQASLGRRPTYAEFTTDRGQVVGGANLENGKQAFATEFVQRQAFLQKYPLSMDGPAFVDALISTAGQASGVVDLSTRRASLLAQYNLGINQTDSRVRVVRALIEDSAFSAALYNPAFVLMQYFGYLRRPPDQTGYNFWLDHLNNRNPNNYRAMVCAFITSHEYQRRFSTLITRSNLDCAP